MSRQTADSRVHRHSASCSRTCNPPTAGRSMALSSQRSLGSLESPQGAERPRRGSIEFEQRSQKRLDRCLGCLSRVRVVAQVRSAFDTGVLVGEWLPGFDIDEHPAGLRRWRRCWRRQRRGSVREHAPGPRRSVCGKERSQLRCQGGVGRRRWPVGREGTAC